MLRWVSPVISLHQDLNGDGTIGVTGHGDRIRLTSPVQVGSNFYMSNSGSGTQSALMYLGAHSRGGAVRRLCADCHGAHGNRL